MTFLGFAKARRRELLPRDSAVAAMANGVGLEEVDCPMAGVTPLLRQPQAVPPRPRIGARPRSRLAVRFRAPSGY